jgi:hypothetical protein
MTAPTSIVIAIVLTLASCGGTQEPSRERSVLEPSTDCYSECMTTCLSPSGFNDYGPCLASCSDKPYGPCPPVDLLAPPAGELLEPPAP